MIRRTVNHIRGIALTLSEVLGSFVKRRNRRFLILLPILMILAALLAIASSSSVLAPFVYPLF